MGDFLQFTVYLQLLSLARPTPNRDTHGNEVDLILKQGRTLIPFEIKSAATFTDGFTKGIDKFRNLVGDRSQNGFVLYNGNERFAVNKLEIINPLKHGETLFQQS